MSQPTDPTAAWMKAWQDAATASMNAWQKVLQQPPSPEGLNQVGQLWLDLWGSMLAAAPASVAQAWAQKAFGQAGIAPAVPAFDPTAMPGLQPPDPDALQQVWRKGLGEYEAELSKLPPDAFSIDWEPLLGAWRRVAAGAGSEADAATVRRFFEAMAVKAKYGPEYYADPERAPVRPTPRELVHRRGRIELFRYVAAEPAADRPPVLIVYSVINQSYILDLVEGGSFVAHLLQRGLDVWMIEWNGAVSGDRDTTLDAYIEGIGACVEHIAEQTGRERVALFGHCIGGTLGAMHAALRPETVSRFVALTAPFQAPAEGVTAMAVDQAVFDVDKVVDQHGHMPAKLIRYTFMSLKPWYEALKWKMFVESVDKPELMERFAVIDAWANDNVDVPAEVFRKYIDEVFHSRRLIDGKTEIGGQRVDLSRIDCPVLSLHGAGDWIVPADSAQPLVDLASGPVRSEELPGGHLGLVLDPGLRPQWDAVADFLAGAELPASG